MDPGTSDTRVVALDALAGAALVTGAVTPWLRTGPGHTLGGLDLADQLLGGQLSPSWGRAAGTALYMTVGIGALLLASSMVRNRVLDIARLSVAATMISATVVVVVLSWFPASNWGLAPMLAVGGLMLSCCANSLSLLRRRHVTQNLLRGIDDSLPASVERPSGTRR